MAVRTSGVGGFRGGLGRWVGVEDARAILDEVAALRTAGELADWGNGAARGRFAVLLGYRVRLRGDAGRAEPLTAGDRATATGDAIVALAADRRSDAIGEHARRHRLTLRQADALARCPACDGPPDVFYCREHHGEQDADVAALLAETP